MYKGIIETQIPVSEYECIPFDTVVNTNKKVSVKDGKVTFNKPGLYEVTVEVIITNVNIGNVILHLMVNDGEKSEASAIDTFTEDDEFKTLTISDIVKVDKGSDRTGRKATVAAWLSENCEVYKGFMTVKEIL